MKKHALTLATLLAIYSTAALAQGSTSTESSNLYQHDISAELSTTNDDFGDGLYGINYRYYFTPVATDKGPYALSSFLAQTSNLGGGVQQASTFNDTTSYHIDGRYVFDSKWYVSAGYSLLDYDDEPNFGDGRDNSSAYGIGAGYYINDTTDISTSYWTSSESSSDSNYFDESDIKSYNVDIRSFIPLEAFSGIYLNGGLNYVEYDFENGFTSGDFSSYSNGDTETTTLLLAADWYITPSWSVGAAQAWSWSKGNYQYGSSYYDSAEGEHESDSSILSLSTRYWWQISQHFSAQFSLSKSFVSEDDNDDDDAFGIGIEVNARL